MRDILDAICDAGRSGGAWRLLPHEFPPWQTVYHYFRYFRQRRLDGTWERLPTAWRETLRTRGGRQPQPSAGVLDRQAVQTTSVGGVRGYDGGKQVSGRKRHVLVETQGLGLRARVHSAARRDRAAGPLRLAGAADQFPRLDHVWVDQGYTGSGKAGLEEQLGWRIEVVQHPPKPRGVWAPVGAVIDWDALRPKGCRGVRPRLGRLKIGLRRLSQSPVQGATRPRGYSCRCEQASTRG